MRHTFSLAFLLFSKLYNFYLIEFSYPEATLLQKSFFFSKKIISPHLNSNGIKDGERGRLLFLYNKTKNQYAHLDDVHGMSFLFHMSATLF
jgi:hypothetical protein